MTPVLAPETYPLAYDSAGALHVEGSRIPLDNIVYAFQDGASPEEICEHNPSLPLSSIYAAITYHLRHRDEVEAYLRRREAAADEVRQRVESWSPNSGLRQKLRARLGA
jgi:uncharacterized protein (DUF433 family)